MKALISLDGWLGRVSMYRLVTIMLTALVAVMLLLTAAGSFTDPFTVPAQAATLGVLLLASVLSNVAFGVVFGVHAHLESSVITGLLLFLLYWPTTEAVDLAWLATIASLASASKYLLVWRGRHLFNPTAAGALLAAVLQSLLGRDSPIGATWWIASEQLLPFVVVSAALVLWRTRRFELALTFIILVGALIVWSLAAGLDVGPAIRTAFTAYPIVFLAGFMLSEPLTLPSRRWQQLSVAALVAVIFAAPVTLLRLGVGLPDLGALTITPELALLAGNLLAFLLCPRRRIGLRVEGNRSLGSEVYEVRLTPRQPLKFLPGQYLELQVPHRSDRRGTRRMFSISSPPQAPEVTVAMRAPQPSSSLKRALLGSEPGTKLTATGVYGDFVWPSGNTGLLLVAGGIGVTPFMSQLRSGQQRDVVLVYGLTEADHVPYRDELIATGVRVVLVSSVRPVDVPPGWKHVQALGLSAGVVVAAVPDAAERIALISGPPGMVDALRHDLRSRCRRILTDHFTGY